MIETPRIMAAVLLALIPGVLAECYWFGAGTLLVTTASMASAQIAASIARRRREVDLPALVSGALIGVALPPLAPWWVGAVGAAAAIWLARELYGGLGANLFNPAMVGYAVVLVAFPAELARWPGAATPDLGTTLACFFGLGANLDGVTGATALDAFRFRQGLTQAELFASDPRFGAWGGAGWEWIGTAFLAGGLYLLQRRVITAHAPAGFLAGIALPALLFADGGSSSGHGGVLFHWFTGGTMLAAFFVVTDPVTSPGAPAARFLAAFGVGVTSYLIRAFGHYPDGIAFAVLLGNALVPLLDRQRWRLEHA